MAATSLLRGIGPLHRISLQPAQENIMHQAIKKVSWAPEGNLRQVRLFLAEDPPLQSGLDDQDHLQGKRCWLWHGDGSGSKGDLPPGYGNNYRKQTVQEDAIIPQTTWCCPPRFSIKSAWQLVAGDESLEVDAQINREVRNLEAMYPRPSAIPPSPAEPQEPQEDFDDSDTPIIPLIPIEDDETEELNEVPLDQDFWKLGRCLQERFKTTADIDGMQLCSTRMISDGGNSVVVSHMPFDQESHASLSIFPATELGTSAASAAAFLAITRSNEKGCMIDQDLLIKIFSDPKMIETLISQHSKNNNTPMHLMPISEPINGKCNGPIAPSNVDQDQNLLAISRPQGASQVAPSGLPGNTGYSFMKNEIACSNFQGPANLCNMDAEILGTAVRSLAQTTSLPVALSAALSHTSRRLLSRPATNCVTPTMATCQPSKGISTAAPTVSIVHNHLSFPDELYYRDLIQKHGAQNESELLNHQRGLQFYKDLIQQHGGAQNSEEERRSQGSKIHYTSSDGLGGNFDNTERSCIDPNRSKFRKLCLYFNTPNGCHRGASCTFLHMESDRPRLDTSELQYSKRVKADAETPERS